MATIDNTAIDLNASDSCDGMFRLVCPHHKDSHHAFEIFFQSLPHRWSNECAYSKYGIDILPSHMEWQILDNGFHARFTTIYSNIYNTTSIINIITTIMSGTTKTW